MIRLIENSLNKHGDGKFLFVRFNAWLYQGYDDARAALMDVIARALLQRAEATKTGLDKAKELLRRVDWIRAAKLAAGPAISLALGLPPIGLAGEAIGAVGRLLRGGADKEDVQSAVAGTPILHWFSGTQGELERAIRLGCWFSIGPAMLAGNKGKQLACAMPRDRVLTETDGPFTKKGDASLMPWDVLDAERELARMWELGDKETQALLLTNLRRLVTGRELDPGICGP